MGLVGLMSLGVALSCCELEGGATSPFVEFEVSVERFASPSKTKKKKKKKIEVDFQVRGGHII